MAAAWAPLIAELAPEAIALIKDLVNHFHKHPATVPAVKAAVASAGVDVSSTSLDADNPDAT